MEFFKSIGGVAYNDILGVVSLNDSGIRHLIGQHLTWRKAATIEAIPAVIENGEIVKIEDNHKGYGFDSVLIAAPVRLESDDCIMGVVVKQDANKKNSYYFHDVFIVDKKGTNISNLQNGSKTVANIDSIFMILKDMASVKTSRMDGDIYEIPYIIANAQRTYYKEEQNSILYVLNDVDTTYYVEEIISKEILSGRQMIKTPIGVVPKVYLKDINKKRAITSSPNVLKPAPRDYAQSVPMHNALNDSLSSINGDVNTSRMDDSGDTFAEMQEEQSSEDRRKIEKENAQLRQTVTGLLTELARAKKMHYSINSVRRPLAEIFARYSIDKATLSKYAEEVKRTMEKHGITTTQHRDGPKNRASYFFRGLPISEKERLLRGASLIEK